MSQLLFFAIYRRKQYLMNDALITNWKLENMNNYSLVIFIFFHEYIIGSEWIDAEVLTKIDWFTSGPMKNNRDLWQRLV